MGKMTNFEFVKRLKDVVDNHNTLYVMGCFGAPLNGANVERYTSNHSYNRKPERTQMIKDVANKDFFGFDCVCLIKAILWGWEGDTSKTYGGAVYASNKVPDISANLMITKCLDVSTDFSNLEIGEALWLKGHIGVYIGEGLAIECTPQWENKVQITSVANTGISSTYPSRTWTKRGKLPYIEYLETTSFQPIKVGDRVKVALGASTYTGGRIARFVYDGVYTVDELKEDRAVLDKKGICTPVNVKDLILV